MIKQLLEENWIKTGDYSRYYIMSREEERLLYCPKENKVILTYTMKSSK